MSSLKYIFLAVGTLAFFISVYLSIKHPELVETPGEATDTDTRRLSANPLRKWDQWIAWVMWGGWGCAALLGFLAKVGVLETPD